MSKKIVAPTAGTISVCASRRWQAPGKQDETPAKMLDLGRNNFIQVRFERIQFALMTLEPTNLVCCFVCFVFAQYQQEPLLRYWQVRYQDV